MSKYGVAQTPIMRNTRTSLIKKKMKLSLKQKIRRWIMDDSEDYATESICIDPTPSLDSDGFRLQVHKANGGLVVETKRYDRRKDDNINGLYVITEDKDLGEEIGKIITMENLRG